MKLKYLIMTVIIAISIFAAGVLCFAAASDVPVADTSAEDIVFLTGAVTALESDRLTLHDGVQEYIVLLPETVVYEGKELLEVGDHITVRYNGITTRSLPPQLNADAIACHVLTGVVSGMSEGQFLLTLNDGSEFAVVYDAAQFMGVQDGMTVSIYYNGASTRSLPPQVSADFIRMPAMTGVISALTESEFTLTDENGIETIVHIAPETFSFIAPADGMTVRVTTDGTATLSLPAQVTAVEILPAE